MVAGGPSSPRVLAIGLSCPAGLTASLENGFKNVVHIVRSLHATSSCFISQCIIKLPAPGESAQVVVKSYTKAKLEEAELQQVELEIRLHHKLTDRHAVPFWVALEDSSQIHIISKFCPEGDLRQRITAGHMSEATVRDQVILPLLHVLLDMHSKGIVHRDLKPENVFLSGDHVLLGDFGLAVALPEHPADTAAATSTANGLAQQLPAPGLIVAMDSRVSSSGMRTPELPPRSSSACGYLSSNCTTAGCANHPALKRVSFSSSDVLALADCSAMDGNAAGGAGCRLTLAGVKRCSSAGSAGVWGQAAMPQMPSEVAGGTPAYSAPEIVKAAFNCTPAASAVGPQNDIWALGVLAIECLTGQHPFGDPEMSPYAFMFNIIGSKQLPLQQLPVTEQCKDWLAQALQKDPNQRASAQQLLQHEWVVMKLGCADVRLADTQSAMATITLVANTQADDESSSGFMPPCKAEAEQSWQCKSPCPVRPCKSMDGSLAADLLKLSSLTEAEAATTGWQYEAPRDAKPSWGQSLQSRYNAAAIWGSGCGGAVAAAPAGAFDDGLYSSNWQTAPRSGCHVQELACRLQQHSSCPAAATTAALSCSATPNVAVDAPWQQQRKSVTLEFLDSISSWED